MNVLILRHSAEQAEINGKRHVMKASVLEHSTGYALNKAQIASIQVGDPIYIVDKDNQIAFLGEIKAQEQRIVHFPSKKEKRQDFTIKNLEPKSYVTVPFIRGWETHRGVKVMPFEDFKALFS